jgi:hypothetical protein
LLILLFFLTLRASAASSKETGYTDQKAQVVPVAAVVDLIHRDAVRKQADDKGEQAKNPAGLVSKRALPGAQLVASIKMNRMASMANVLVRIFPPKSFILPHDILPHAGKQMNLEY